MERSGRRLSLFAGEKSPRRARNNANEIFSFRGIITGTMAAAG
jgi:hypothetical protein